MQISSGEALYSRSNLQICRFLGGYVLSVRISCGKGKQSPSTGETTVVEIQGQLFFWITVLVGWNGWIEKTPGCKGFWTQEFGNNFHFPVVGWPLAPFSGSWPYKTGPRNCGLLNKPKATGSSSLQAVGFGVIILMQFQVLTKRKSVDNENHLSYLAITELIL